MLTRFLLFLDATAPRYYAAVALAGAATLALTTFAGGKRRWWTAAPLFWLAVALTLLAGRWPGVMFPRAFVVDEDQFLAQALTAAGEPPVPWEAFDGHTAGPLNTLVLVPPAAWFGAPLNYVTGRLVGLGTILFGLWALCGLLRRAFPDEERTARVGILPLLGFYTLTDFNDFMHYTSEHLPAALQMGAFAAAGTLLFAARNRVWAWALGTGFVLGLIPFAKLQAVPAALVTAAAGYGFLWARRGELGERRWRGANVALTVGGLLFPFGLMGLLLARGVFGDFWRSYIGMQFAYVNQPDPLAWQGLWERVPDFWAWFWPMLGWSAAGALLAWPPGGWRRVGRPGGLLAGAALAVLAASAYEIHQPHRAYGHYLLFAVFPAGTLAAVVLGVLLRSAGERPLPDERWNGWRWAAAGLFVLAGVVPMVARRAEAGHLWRGRLPEFLAHRPPAVVTRLRALLPPAGGPDRTMAVWGWRPELVVLTGARLGTRDGHAQHQLEAGPLRGYYRARFLADMTRKRPALFVDATAPESVAFTDRATFGFENDPALAAHVAAHYALAEEVDGVRIFRRRDLVLASGSVPAPVTNPASAPAAGASGLPPGEAPATGAGEEAAAPLPLPSAVETPSSPAAPAGPPVP